MATSSRLPLRDLDVNARHDLLAERSGVDRSVLDALRPDAGLTLDQADHMIENVVGVLGVPVGIACNFTVNGSDGLMGRCGGVLITAVSIGTRPGGDCHGPVPHAAR